MDAVLHHLADVDHFPDFRHGTQHSIPLKELPIGVVADEARLVLRHVGIEAAFDLGAQGLQHFPLFGDGDSLEDFQVGRMHRKQPHELFEPFGHAAVERRELLKVFPNLGPLLVGFGQQPLGDDVGHVLPDDAKLLEAVLHPAQTLGDELELRVVEQALLQARNEAEADQLADLADLPQKAKVEDQIVLPARPEVVEQFVHDQEQPVVGVLAR